MAQGPIKRGRTGSKSLNRALNAAPTTTVRGGVLKQAAVAPAAGANPTKAEYDALLVKLKAAGILA